MIYVKIIIFALIALLIKMWYDLIFKDDAVEQKRRDDNNSPVCICGNKNCFSCN